MQLDTWLLYFAATLGLSQLFLIMAATFALVEIVTELVIAGFASRVSGWFQRSGKAFNRVCGALFVLIGAWLPLSR